MTRPLLTTPLSNSIQALVRLGTQLLSGSESPRLDAELLLSNALGVDRVHLLAHHEQQVPENISASYRALINERRSGLPIAYLLGEREFWSLNLEVDRATLVPRPDTELLVSLTLERLPAAQRAVVVDLGTGCGAIALALCHERPNWQLVAIDDSCAALRVADRNRRRLGCVNLHLMAGNWVQALTLACADLIVSNPPYIEDDDRCLTESDIRHEPAHALCGGPDGLQSLAEIIRGSVLVLRSGGHLLVEHGAGQGEACRELFARNGYRNVMSHRDLAGRERVSSGQWIEADAGA